MPSRSSSSVMNSSHTSSNLCNGAFMSPSPIPRHLPRPYSVAQGYKVDSRARSRLGSDCPGLGSRTPARGLRPRRWLFLTGLWSARFAKGEVWMEVQIPCKGTRPVSRVRRALGMRLSVVYIV